MKLYPECEKCAHRESDINGACGICTQIVPSKFIKREAEPFRAPCGHTLPGCNKMTYVGMTSRGYYENRKRGDPSGNCTIVIEHGNCPEGFKPEEVFPDECTKDPCPECGSRVVFRNIYGQWKCISCGIGRHAPDGPSLLCECGHEKLVHYQNQGFCSYYQGEGCTCQKYRPKINYEIHIKECPLADLLDDGCVLCIGTDGKLGNYNCPDLVKSGKCPKGYHRVDYTPHCDICGNLMKLEWKQVGEYYCQDCEKYEIKM